MTSQNDKKIEELQEAIKDLSITLASIPDLKSKGAVIFAINQLREIKDEMVEREIQVGGGSANGWD